eukprot:jgi/Ulvmu1/9323/UM050_0073.1
MAVSGRRTEECPADAGLHGGYRHVVLQMVLQLWLQWAVGCKLGREVGSMLPWLDHDCWQSEYLRDSFVCGAWLQRVQHMSRAQSSGEPCVSCVVAGVRWLRLI